MSATALHKNHFDNAVLRYYDRDGGKVSTQVLPRPAVEIQDNGDWHLCAVNHVSTVGGTIDHARLQLNNGTILYLGCSAIDEANDGTKHLTISKREVKKGEAVDVLTPIVIRASKRPANEIVREMINRAINVVPMGKVSVMRKADKIAKVKERLSNYDPNDLTGIDALGESLKGEGIHPDIFHEAVKEWLDNG